MTQEEYDRLSAIITDLQYFAIESKPQDKYEQLKRLKPPFLVINEYTTDEERRLHKIRSQEYLRQLNQILKGGTQKKVTGEQKQQAYFTKKELESMPTLKDCHIRQKPNGTYEIRYRRLGFEKSFSSKKLKEAKARCYEWLATLNVDLKSHVLKPQEKKFTRFIDFADNYMETVKRPNVATETYVSYFRKYKRYIKARYHNLTFNELTPIRLQKDLGELRNKVGRSYEDVRVLLNGIFKYAVANGIIERNPIDAVFIAPHERTTGQALTLNAERDFIKKISGHIYEPAYLILLYTGCRPCEYSSFTYDVESDTITLKNGKLKRHQKIKTRTLPVFPMLRPHLKKNLLKRFCLRYCFTKQSF